MKTNSAFSLTSSFRHTIVFLNSKNSVFAFFFDPISKLIHSALFGGLFLSLLFLSNHFSLLIPRYDFLLFGALMIQAILIYTKYETKEDALVVVIFHILGMLMEVFKTHQSIGSWSYPEFSYITISGVPAYAGFMYASVGSFMVKAWSEFNFSLSLLPKKFLVVILCVLVYFNFFSHHFIFDVRYLLIVGIIFFFWRTTISFTICGIKHSINLMVAFLCFGLLIWIGENIATYFGAWKYPNQLDSWHFVPFQKIISWSLLAIVSFMIIAIKKKSWKK